MLAVECVLLVVVCVLLVVEPLPHEIINEVSVMKTTFARILVTFFIVLEFNVKQLFFLCYLSEFVDPLLVSVDARQCRAFLAWAALLVIFQIESLP